MEPAGGAVRRGHGRQPRDADRLAGARERRGGRVRERDGGARAGAGRHAHRERVAHRRRGLADAPRARGAAARDRPRVRRRRRHRLPGHGPRRPGADHERGRAALPPDGLIGAVGAAAAGARLLRLSEDETVNALALAANTAGGLNEWPHSGGGEMFFHPGFAARNAVTSVLLARAGAEASPSALDGPRRALRFVRRRAPRDARAWWRLGDPRRLSQAGAGLQFRADAGASGARRARRERDCAGRHRAGAGAELPGSDSLSGVRSCRTVSLAAPGEDEHPVHRRGGARTRPARRRRIPGVRARRRRGRPRPARPARRRSRVCACVSAAARCGGGGDAQGRTERESAPRRARAARAAGVRSRTRAALARLLDGTRAQRIEQEIDAIVDCPDAARIVRLLARDG